MISRYMVLLFLLMSAFTASAIEDGEKKKINWKSFAVTGAFSTQELTLSQVDFSSQIYGFRYANLNQKKFGLYLGGQLNQTSVREADYHFNDENQSHNFPRDLVYIGEKSRQGTANLDIGVTKKLFPATWMFFGPGFCYNRSFYEVALFEDDGRFVETIEAENMNPIKQFTPSAEVGFMVNFRLFNIGLGVKSFNVLEFDFNDAFYNASIGLTLKRKKQK